MIDIAQCPKGNVTFVFTDIEDSSKMTNALGNALYGEKRDEQRARLDALVAEHRGLQIDLVGDGHTLVFQEADEALACVVEFASASIPRSCK